MLEVSLLGDQRVALDSTPLAGTLPRRGVEIIAFLALHPGEPQQRAALAAAVWPDSTDAQALTNLRRELHHLRALLGDDCCITTDSRTIHFEPTPEAHCDVVDFVRALDAARAAEWDGDDARFHTNALRAVSAYGGDLLPASAAEWLVPERDALHRQCVHLLDRLVAVCEEESISEALEHAEHRLRLEPMQERSYQVLMRLQSHAGDRASAIQTYHRCEALLDAELGVGPDAATVAIYRGLVATDTTSPRAPAPRPLASEPHLVGREGVLADVLRWRERGDLEAPPLHLLRGEAGMGKSRLMAEVAARAASDGVTVATARCMAGPGRIALGPVAEWLGSDTMRIHRVGLAPEWAAEVDRLLPAEARGHAGAESHPMVDAWQRHHFFEGLARALLPAGPAEQPILLVLDDLQWCDPETLLWLPMFLDVTDGGPVRLLAGVRDEELPGHPMLSTTVQNLHAAGRVSESTLEPLSVAETASLAGRVLGRSLSSQDADRWHEATGGVPLFVIETARSRLAQQPSASTVGQLPRVQAVLRSRLEEVSPASREVAGLAAAVGRGFHMDLLVEASDRSENEIVDAVDELWHRRIIRETSGVGYDFTHDLIRDAAYEQLSPPQRPLVHRRIAQAIELQAEGEGRAVAARLAEQYDKANAPRRAIANYAVSAKAAVEVFAYRSAVRRQVRALELLTGLADTRERDELELSLRQAMAEPLNALEGYASPTLRSNLERAALLAERLRQPRPLLLTLVGLFAVRFVQGDIDESFRIGERALALSADHPDLAGQAHFAVGGSASELGRHELGVEHLTLAHELAMNDPPLIAGTRTEVHARAWSAHSLWALGRDDDAVRAADWAIARAEEVNQPYSLAVARAYAAITHQLRHDVDATEHYARLTIEICDRYDFAYYRQWGVVLSGWCLGGGAGLARVEQGLDELRSTGAMARHPYYLSLLAELHLDGGDQDTAVKVLTTALVLAEQNDDRWWVPELLRLQARAVGGDQAAELRRRARLEAEAGGAVALLRRLSEEP